MNELILISGFILAFLGCEVPTGPKANIEINHAGGNYIMTGLIDIPNGRAIPVDRAPEKRYLHIRLVINSLDSRDSIYVKTGMRYYYVLTFFDADGKETSSICATRWSYDYDEKHFQEHQWLRMDNSTGVLAVLEMDSSRGVTTRVMLSNIMKSTAYRADLDTIRYIYRPKFR